MSVHEILNHLLAHDLPRSLQIIGSELVLCATIIVLLFIRMFDLQRQIPTNAVALFGAMIVFIGVFTQFMYSKGSVDNIVLKAIIDAMLKVLNDVWMITQSGVGTPGPYFTGLLTHDQFSV